MLSGAALHVERARAWCFSRGHVCSALCLVQWCNGYVLDKHLVEHLRLRHRAREAIEDEALFALGALNVLADDADNDVVGDEAARLHHRVRLFAHLRAWCREHREGRSEREHLR